MCCYALKQEDIREVQNFSVYCISYDEIRTDTYQTISHLNLSSAICVSLVCDKMDLRIAGHLDNKGYYGSVSETLHNANSADNDILTASGKPDSEINCGGSTLNIYNVGYVVKERVGPWWEGACFRKIKKKTVLRHISIQVTAGRMTAILGNSGKFTC